MIKTSRLLLLAMALGGFTNPTLAAPIEHIGDRYIMHVSEMDLTGEESLLDVLMMCPEVLTMDGNNIIGGDPFANLYGKFVIRIDNQEYGLDWYGFSSVSPRHPEPGARSRYRGLMLLHRG